MDESLKCKVAAAMKGVFKMSPGSFFEPGEEDTKAYPKLGQMLQPDIFAMKGEKVHAVVENASLPAIKWVRSGVRQIIMMKFAHTGEYVRSKLGGVALKQPISSMGTLQWLTNCGHDKLTEYVESNPSVGIFRNTLGPGDMLYTPPGWIKLEMGNEDSIVVRMTLIPRNSMSAFISDLRIAVADLLGQGRRNALLDFMLQVALKQFELREAEAKKRSEEEKTKADIYLTSLDEQQRKEEEEEEKQKSLIDNDNHTHQSKLNKDNHTDNHAEESKLTEGQVA